jgi:hypothetical protein
MFDNIKPPCEAFAALRKQEDLTGQRVRRGQADLRVRTTSHGCTPPPPKSRASRTIYARRSDQPTERRWSNQSRDDFRQRQAGASTVAVIDVDFAAN